MSVSASSSAAGFHNESPSQSLSLAPNPVAGGAAAGVVPNGEGGQNSSSMFKKTFSVSSLKSLNRRQVYVIVLEFEKGTVSFHKVRRGKEVKRSFPFASCVKLEREAKNPCLLTATFG